MNRKTLPSYSSIKNELTIFYVYHLFLIVGVILLNIFMSTNNYLLLNTYLIYIIIGNGIILYLEIKYNFVIIDLINFVYRSKKYKSTIVSNKIVINTLTLSMIMISLYLFTIYNFYIIYGSPLFLTSLYLLGFSFMISTGSNIIINKFLINKYGVENE